jgi:hypothetical protein
MPGQVFGRDGVEDVFFHGRSSNEKPPWRGNGIPGAMAASIQI